MSAFIVSDNNVLLMAIVHLADLKKTATNGIAEIKYPKVSDVITEARALLKENYNSYNHRYKESDDNDDRDISAVTITEDGIRELLVEVGSLHQVYKATACYEYQTCEHPAWETSWSSATCKEIYSKLEYLLGSDPRKSKEYEEASWGIQ